MKKLIPLVIVLALFVAACGVGEAKIPADKAKEIALENAGLTAEDVTFKRVEKDRDNGKIVYEIDFYTKDMIEYDYEIDAETGKIIDWESESVYD